jgi:hypothetical protein
MPPPTYYVRPYTIIAVIEYEEGDGKKDKVLLAVSAKGDPAVAQPATGLIECCHDRFSQSANLRGLEALQIIQQDASMLLAFGDAQRNPPGERGAVFGKERPTVLATSFEQKVVRSVNVRAVLPNGNVLDVQSSTQSAKGYANRGRYV